MMFLVLAAQYESWSLPLAIILIVPMCLLFAIFGVWLRGLDNNLFTQIGLVVLMGLACKNAILIVEFAKQLQDAGRNRTEAAIEASRLRLRPILMTSFAFTFGVVPLMLSHGAGAEMRVSIGTAVFFGMLGVTFFGVVLHAGVLRRHPARLGKRKGPRPPVSLAKAAASGATLVLLLGSLRLVALARAAVPSARITIRPKPRSAPLSPTAPKPTWLRATPPLPGGADSRTHPSGLIGQALATNQDLRIATARVREARALRTRAVADAFPVADATAGYNKSLSSKDSSPFPADSLAARAATVQRGLRRHLGAGYLRPCPPFHPGRHRRSGCGAGQSPGHAGSASLPKWPGTTSNCAAGKTSSQSPARTRKTSRKPWI